VEDTRKNRQGRTHRARSDHSPLRCSAFVQQVKAYERLAVRAAIHGDREAALKALIANPLVARYSVATRCWTPCSEANRKHLPRFFPRLKRSRGGSPISSKHLLQVS